MGLCRILHDVHKCHHSFELSFRLENHTLISHNFLIETYRLLHTSFLHPARNLVQVCALASRLGHFEFKTLWSPTVVHLLLVAVPQVTRKIPSRYVGGPSIFLLPPIWERGIEKNFTFRNFCLSHERTPRASSKKCVQALDTDNAALSASTVEYEFHPYVPWIERRWLQERKGHSTASHSVCSVQEWFACKYSARNY